MMNGSMSASLHTLLPRKPLTVQRPPPVQIIPEKPNILRVNHISPPPLTLKSKASWERSPSHSPDPDGKSIRKRRPQRPKPQKTFGGGGPRGGKLKTSTIGKKSLSRHGPPPTLSLVTNGTHNNNLPQANKSVHPVAGGATLLDWTTFDTEYMVPLDSHTIEGIFNKVYSKPVVLNPAAVSEELDTLVPCLKDVMKPRPPHELRVLLLTREQNTESKSIDLESCLLTYRVCPFDVAALEGDPLDIPRLRQTNLVTSDKRLDIDYELLGKKFAVYESKYIDETSYEGEGLELLSMQPLSHDLTLELAARQSTYSQEMAKLKERLKDAASHSDHTTTNLLLRTDILFLERQLTLVNEEIDLQRRILQRRVRNAEFLFSSNKPADSTEVIASLHKYSTHKRLWEGLADRTEKPECRGEGGMLEPDCCICFGGESLTSNQIVYCATPDCGLGCHQSCAQIHSLPETDFFCSYCTLKKTPPRECELCKNAYPLPMKVLGSQTYHFSCLLLNGLSRLRSSHSQELHPQGLRSPGRQTQTALHSCKLCSL
jgi:hypothetical protein